ncbi:acetyltransferase [Guptibacillus hwajinpoensis]|uniref:acetyltransferase n=1 Tax=Guptibacillus hwajinpoensis TaxID=208199 RepID=UPI003736C43A
MKDIIIYGSGGFAREVAFLIEQINSVEQKWNIIGFIDDNIQNQGVIHNGYPVLGDTAWLEENCAEINIALGIGSPKVKKLIVEKLSKVDIEINFPNLIHPAVKFSNTNEIGQGNIICEGNVLTCNISIGDFVILNINSTVGHDTKIKNYCTVLPNVSISGNVTLSEGVDFGTNGTIIQGITVGKYTIIGAGAVVVKDLPEYCTAVGMPAKPIKYHEEYV